jgi:hypothetical protein
VNRFWHSIKVDESSVKVLIQLENRSDVAHSVAVVGSRPDRAEAFIEIVNVAFLD